MPGQNDARTHVRIQLSAATPAEAGVAAGFVRGAPSWCYKMNADLEWYSRFFKVPVTGVIPELMRDVVNRKPET
jgi:hypothetical protein